MSFCVDVPRATAPLSQRPKQTVIEAKKAMQMHNIMLLLYITVVLELLKRTRPAALRLVLPCLALLGAALRFSCPLCGYGIFPPQSAGNSGKNSFCRQPSKQSKKCKTVQGVQMTETGKNSDKICTNKFTPKRKQMQLKFGVTQSCK